MTMLGRVSNQHAVVHTIDVNQKDLTVTGT